MLSTVKNLLATRGISLCAPLRLCDATVLRPHLLKRVGIEDGTAFLFAVPYYTTFCDDSARNISAYAVSRDYHLFFEELFDELIPALAHRFPTHKFAGFADHSPIAEVDAAAKAGLGTVGENHLLLTKDHSSFVFLGEIITDAILPVTPQPIDVCASCGACLAACPVDLSVDRCLSALTQKKGELTAEEKSTILASGCLWGCDICQSVCPVTRAAKAAGTLYTTIPFFKEGTISSLTKTDLEEMSEEAFAARAYAWRGKQVILRNLSLKEEKSV